MRTATRLRPFGTTVFAEISARARAAQAIDLGQGMPDFDGPESIKAAAAEAMRAEHNQYAPMPGIAPLREAIARDHEKLTGLAVDPAAEVTVTAGCTGALAACHLGLFEPGDRVLAFEPFYDAYRADAALAGAHTVPVPLRRDDTGAFAFDTAELDRLAAGCGAILVNTPHNPTGKVFTRNELEAIADVARRHDLIVIADEVYDRLVFDGAEHVSIATLPGMRERTITLGSFGKMFSLTGWKIGWAIARPDLTTAVRAAHQFINFAIATPLQHAAAHAMNEEGGYLRSLPVELQARRDRLASCLDAAGFRFALPESGYFILADHTAVSSRLGISGDVELCRWLIERAGVAAIPPSAFYAEPERGRHLIRFAFCKTEATLDEAARRLAAALGTDHASGRIPDHASG